jgi:transcriptional accessory protein Tex/SPT6
MNIGTNGIQSEVEQTALDVQKKTKKKATIVLVTTIAASIYVLLKSAVL